MKKQTKSTIWPRRRAFTARSFVLVSLAIMLSLTSMYSQTAAAVEDEPLADNIVVTQQAAQWVEGNKRIVPAQGTAGTTNKYNFWLYNLPGEFIQNEIPPTYTVALLENPPYTVAYANASQPVQTHDWWTGVGLQWPGWIIGADPANPVIRTPGFYNEPWQMNFIDLPNNKAAPGLGMAPQGIRLWNRTAMRIVTPAITTTIPFLPGNSVFGYGNNAQEESPIVTLGLSGTHPLAENTPITHTESPWTNIKVHRYTDWSVEMSYANGGSEMYLTMANGSPFIWAERTQGAAPFVVWAGTAVSGDDNGQISVWRNSGGVLGINVTNSFVPIGPQTSNMPSPAAYAVIANAGTWVEQQTTDPSKRQSMFTNTDPGASRVVVIAMPHNVPLTDTVALNAALDTLIPYAAQRMVNTQIHFPPITGSDSTVIISGTTKPLGYDRDNATLRIKHAISTEVFLNSQPAGPALQMVLPHHRKVMIAQDKANIPQGNDGKPRFTWRSLKGELQAYIGNDYVRELRVRGMLPFLPSAGVNDTSPVLGKVPAQDIYDSMKTWFYLSEPNTGAFNSFAVQSQNYFGGQQNTYVPSLATLFEGVTIADQLSKSQVISAQDSDLKQSRNAVAAVIRDNILDTLKEFMGRLANIYTSNVFQYNTDYDTFVGYPEGYGSVQTLNDKHFHWGYFLRSAVAIGQRDPAWLQAYLPFFNELRADVSNYDRNNLRYPFLRNFSPFYGHSWADGVGNGGNGSNQESTSEAINFAAGLIGLGQVTGNDDWVDIGMYLYEEEILGIQQYWLNVDGDPTTSSGTFYNGNWPDAFVAYKSATDNVDYKTYYIARIIQIQSDRATFFAQDTTSELTIQAVPLSASHLYFGRDQRWLAEMWPEYVKQRLADPNAQNTAYEVLLSGVQAQLPGTNAGINDPGPIGALTRINTPHKYFYGAVNMQGKYWAYTLNTLGQIDASVVADTPSYGVFCKNGNAPKCVGGQRSFAAYNPTNDDALVTFKDVDTGATLLTMDVPARSLTMKVGSNNPGSEYLSQAATKAGRLYLRKTEGYPADCGPVQPITLTLTASPGTWRLTGGTASFPTDTSALGPSIVCVPKRTQPATVAPPNTMPAPELTRVWTGVFSGRLIPATPYTRFSIYTNQSLFPGWQLNPCVAGGFGLPAQCPNANWNDTIAPAGNVVSFQVWYDFERDGNPDRVEWYQNMPLDISNAWSYNNKLTEYATTATWPSLAGVPVIPGGDDGQKKSPFPAFISASKPASITLYMYGGSNNADIDGKLSQFDVPVSVNASPLTNRASWIQPPYQLSTVGVVPPISPEYAIHLPFVQMGE